MFLPSNCPHSLPVLLRTAPSPRTVRNDDNRFHSPTDASMSPASQFVNNKKKGSKLRPFGYVFSSKKQTFCSQLCYSS